MKNIKFVKTETDVYTSGNYIIWHRDTIENYGISQWVVYTTQSDETLFTGSLNECKKFVRNEIVSDSLFTITIADNKMELNGYVIKFVKVLKCYFIVQNNNADSKPVLFKSKNICECKEWVFNQPVISVDEIKDIVLDHEQTTETATVYSGVFRKSNIYIILFHGLGYGFRVARPMLSDETEEQIQIVYGSSLNYLYSNGRFNHEEIEALKTSVKKFVNNIL